MEKKWKIIIGTIPDVLIIFSPVILSTVALFYYSQNNDGWFYSIINRLSHINGNYYTVNNVLLVYIIAAYLTILIGFIYYFNGIFNDVYQYNGENKSVGLLNKFSSLLLYFVIALLVLYMAFLYLSCSDHITIGDKFFKLDSLIIVNKYLSIVVFLIFLLADLASWRSNFIQRKEHQETIKEGKLDTAVTIKIDHNNNEITLAREKIDHNNNEITLARDATFLINIPVLIITSLSIFFTYLIHGAGRFRSIVDQQLSYIEVKASNALDVLCHKGVQWGSACAYPQPLNEDLFELFLNGLETGVITATIIISQWVFIVLRIMWKLRKLNFLSNEGH